MTRFKHLTVARGLGLLWLTGLSAVQAQTVHCPASIGLQVKAIAPVAADGAPGLVRGFGQVFSPRKVRLVGVWIGTVRDGEVTPSFPLEPDDLTATMGRRSVYTLWNGSPPAPEGVVHLVCEYEAGLVLNKAVGSKVRRCELTTQVQGKAAKAPAKGSPPAKPPKGERAAPAAEAADPAPDTAQAQPIVTKGVVSCR